ncbi:MAG: antibiotic biosynthesis monooxygenase [Desulfarculaceae bacterium]|nr:antibiotic biosynthesis monooxygenase [Desulfarculaceae bacterium]MCF8072802.1 antibiotic biosynthesis monooxygenase [Desulfarculaceae bacterium]MCF8100970.1 antibiotic biosynthesis monooxygenase [Desulfarculaceae bacterium]MCF8118534.1 antibiotic biosynthesis monooxygenase [Desulfarculaceae bacterium]
MREQQNKSCPEETIRSSIRMLIPLGRHREALEILKSVHARVKAESNCISARIYRGLDDDSTIMIEELWKSQEDILHHLRSDDYRQVLLVLEMAEEPPDIRFDTIAHSGGVDIIRNARVADPEP